MTAVQPATATAPGKIILFGEHAVVHGQPAIAVPLAAVQVTASVEPGPPGHGTIVYAPDAGKTLTLREDAGTSGDPLYDAVGYPIEVTRRALGISLPDMTITLRSTIPIASGLGSGAALATAISRAFAEAVGHPLSNDALNPLVYEVEKRHHGTPSGIDNTVIVYEQPVFFVRGAPIETFAIARPFTLLVADSGQPSPTHITVGDVRALYEANPARVGLVFATIGSLVNTARQAIESGTIEILGTLMDKNHALLRHLTVSSDALDDMCIAAKRAGAWGAKLSGGGRGGNIIALVAPERSAAVSEALRAAGAVSVIETTVQ